MERSATIRSPKRPAPVPPMSDKSQARMVRQKILEHEQQMEDLEASKVTAEDLQVLQQSFAGVKAEFMDLDGQSWDSPAAREMLVDWHAKQATREHSVEMSPSGLRMRHQQPRRSLAAVISSATSVEPMLTTEDENAFVDETVRGRPTKAPAPRIDSTAKVDRARRSGVPMRRRGTMVSAAVDDDDDEDFDISTLVAPPGLATPTYITAGPQCPLDPSSKKRTYKALAKVATSGDSRPASTSKPAVFTFAGRSSCRTVSVPASPTRNRTTGRLGRGTIVLSNSPKLNQSASFSDAGYSRGGPVPMRRTSCSLIVTSGNVKTVPGEFFPGIHVDATPPRATGPRSSMSHEQTVTLASSRLVPAPWRPRERQILSRDGSRAPVTRVGGLFMGKADDDDDEEEDNEDDGVPLARTVSCLGRSPSGEY
ncbi:hypothetical protein L226DRAFT_617274 [Lentinus tigrinus ALCF2SS1-7]|uniref:Uncharacterized protein n=1 Tax=Lentinus tigrinus ALCF2SS1-6 TaxID=1328759 RepID=A0A5C2RRW1_9APHY|nr:hypothetical protein L227DRAFT_657982 [Lentinus tigrinus ALCF2SS1-6]RPD68812.1 hypothetical protein L226DRAFT_617274 [Lentinus tigrinus ALCF2SS1-7]